MGLFALLQDALLVERLDFLGGVAELGHHIGGVGVVFRAATHDLARMLGELREHVHLLDGGFGNLVEAIDKHLARLVLRVFQHAGSPARPWS